jgi:flagellar hook-associated protein 3 FlgL
MRIGTLQIFRQGIDSILQQQTRLSAIQLQLSTGRRINTPSDDPTGAAQLLGLSETLQLTEQYQRNASAARARLELEDAALGAVGDSLQRARELTVQGLNDTHGPDDRAAIALEIRQILDEVKGLANRKDANDDYLFSGFQQQSVPFTDNGAGVFSYNGDQGQRELQIGSGRQVADSDSGLDVFMKIPVSGGGYEDVFTSLYKLATDLEANAPDPNSLDQIDSAIDQLLGFRAQAGARLNAIQSQETINESLLIQLETTRSTIEDLDYAAAASQLSQQSVTLQAAQQAFVRVQNLNLFNYL